MRLARALRRFALPGIALGGLLCAGAALAEQSPQPYRVAVLLSGDGGPYQALNHALRDALTDSDVPITLAQQVLEPDVHWRPSPDTDLVASVGARASQILAETRTTAKALHLLIPSTIYGSLPRPTAGGDRSAIFIDQPVERQLNLIEVALPGVRHVGLLLGEESRKQRDPLETAIGARRWQAHVGLTPESGRYLNTLGRLLDHSRVLLAVPDKAVFNRQNLQGILLSSYRREVPMIGFSPGYVRAGALAAVYSTPEQIARQAAEWIRQQAQLPDSPLPPPSHPAYFSTAVNQQVAKSLRLRIPDEDTLLDSLQQLEEGGQ